MIAIYDSSSITPNRKFLVVVLTYVGVITILWLLLAFGISQIIYMHWFAYVYPTVLIVITNHNRTIMLIGTSGITINKTNIPWENIIHYELKECNDISNKSILEIQTKDQVIRGVLPSAAHTTLLLLLKENISEL